MSPEAFGDYAKKLEREDFEDDVRSLNASLYQHLIQYSITYTQNTY